mmetsp:Transcript_21555/g.49121  ORF Transcript_21555/g.49121 Transcript_21555/m.49121 type:complete len:273 (+) Transcript_21555:1639-2457(+)
MAAQMQNSERPRMGTKEASPKAATLQMDVSETPTPARAKTSPAISGRLCSLMKGMPNSEKQRVSTSMSFTPRPKARKGMPLTTALLKRNPRRRKEPPAAIVAKATTPRPCWPTLHLLAIGDVQLPMLKEMNRFMSTPPAMINAHSGFSSAVSSLLRKSVAKFRASRSGDSSPNDSTVRVHALPCSSRASRISDSTANSGLVRFIRSAILRGPSMYTVHDNAPARASTSPFHSRSPAHIGAVHVALSTYQKQPFETVALISASLRLLREGRVR